MLEESKVVEELKAKHGEIAMVEIAGVNCFFAKGAKGSGERYLDRTLGDNCNGQTKREAVMELACASLVHPEQVAFRAAVSEEPMVIGNELFEVVGSLYGLGKQRQKGKV